MSLPRFSLRYKAIVIAVVGLALAVGVVQFLTMPRRADPEFTILTCQVMTRWPGAAAERVEQLVTYPLELEINTLQEVERVYSTTVVGQSVIYVDLEPTMDPALIQETWEKVRNKVAVVRPRLPEGVMDPVVNDDFGDAMAMLLAVFEQPDEDERRYSPRDLEIIADRIKERIEATTGVASVKKHGVRQEVIYLETPAGNWANIDLTTAELHDLLQARNIYASGGSVESEHSRFSVQPTGEFDAVEQINTVVVDRDSWGAPIYFRDLGMRIHRTYEDPPTILARYGDTSGSYPCVIIGYTMKDGFKVTDLGPHVRQLVHDLQHVEMIVPPDVAVEIVFDESVFVADKIADFVVNVMQAIAIVVMVGLLLAGFRTALVMAAAIPFVMIISIGISGSTGIALEQMSIASLIIALGMLVDNAVVVSDNVRRLQGEGLGREEAVVQGVEQIMYPILMGTLTTVCAFGPMAFILTGEKREYVFSIPAVVSITLLTSWVLALSVTTLMVYWIIRPRRGGGQEKTPLVWLAEKVGSVVHRGSGRRGRSLMDRYESLIGACLRAKPIVIGVAVVLLIAALRLPVGSEFFPDDKRDLLYIDIWLPEGSAIAVTDETADEVEGILRDLSYVEGPEFTGHRLASLYTSVGGSGPRFALGVNPQPPGSNFAQIVVRTADAVVTDQYVADIRAVAERRIPGARIIPRKLGLGPPVDSPLAIRVFGSGFTAPGFGREHDLRAVAEDVKDVFRAVDGVWNVHDAWGDPGYQLDVVIDEDRASLAGVTNAAVANSFNAYFSGAYLTTYREGDHTVPVYVRLPPGERERITDPRTLFVEGDAGKVPLDSVAEVRPRRATTKIERRELNRMIEVRANVEPGLLANDILAEVMPEIDRVEASAPPGMYFDVGGTLAEAVEGQAELGRALGVGLMLIVLCLIIQYNSFVKPLIILMTVPMGAVGAFFGLWVTGKPLGFMALLGLVSLVGIVVNSGILYIEFAEELVRKKIESGEGRAEPGAKSCNGLTRQAFHECLAEAGKIRLLPIALTTLTTIGGLIPLALFGGPLWEGMAWLLIFGLAVATCLTLLVLPSIYAAFVEYFGLTLVRARQPGSQ